MCRHLGSDRDLSRLYCGEQHEHDRYPERICRALQCDRLRVHIEYCNGKWSGSVLFGSGYMHCSCTPVGICQSRHD
eukprot:6502442-Prymnesium_polylepis.1